MSNYPPGVNDLNFDELCWGKMECELCGVIIHDDARCESYNHGALCLECFAEGVESGYWGPFGDPIWKAEEEEEGWYGFGSD